MRYSRPAASAATAMRRVGRARAPTMPSGPSKSSIGPPSDVEHGAEVGVAVALVDDRRSHDVACRRRRQVHLLGDHPGHLRRGEARPAPPGPAGERRLVDGATRRRSPVGMKNVLITSMAGRARVDPAAEVREPRLAVLRRARRRRRRRAGRRGSTAATWTGCRRRRCRARRRAGGRATPRTGRPSSSRHVAAEAHHDDVERPGACVSARRTRRRPCRRHRRRSSTARRRCGPRRPGRSAGRCR